MPSPFDQIDSVAVEHVRWCLAQGDSLSDIVRSVGAEPSDAATFDDAVAVIALAVLAARHEDNQGP